MAELLEQGGYVVQPTRESVFAKDGGIDLIAWRKDQPMLPVLVGVQCKHHSSDRLKAGVEDVQRLIAYRADGPFDLGLVVTNTDFARDALFAAETLERDEAARTTGHDRGGGPRGRGHRRLHLETDP